ncbi:PucR family transcriptional regulator [Mycobacteroides sp. H001]|uniref:PucR family transcriptional regulator n=1 Tax=Mycobacteroides TaxID=670516 RepID=UPI0007141852|nr:MULTISPECIES: helix-turn-helix domain-containing protein [Mycobacteroides]KRQ24839.1 PucR family transcriptional regulator [Mycobacteroides sp. H072]KRQ37730.1 PucR family transcriptional regulator [Mycobacteroides sp. H002]KRQ47114.1 PucR family transcriptional regulator [Mycobacteroides sp. H054]KRQ69239.1 PucR family transcriptional regulator [Mycobacteroides sp. H001]OHU37819.1 PucR family transcriptional regulator [Mycobacteroides chelonae]
MEELWPLPAPEVAEAIRSLCQRLLTDTDAIIDVLAEPGLTAQNSPVLVSDASLVEEDRHLDRSELVQWLTANVQQPGRRVQPYVSLRTTEYLGALVSRGITPDFAGGWRAALGVGWRRWLEECVTHCADRDLLVEVLDVSAKSLAQYALDAVAALREASLSAATGNADADAMAFIQLIASGAPITEDLAEGRLRYRIARAHASLVLWVDDPEQAGLLDEMVATVRSAAEARNSLVARASATSRWIWLSGAAAADLHHVEKAVAKTTDIRAGVGRPGDGLEGFRSSHQDALAAQALVIRLGSTQHFTAYADVELIDSLTKDRASARRFVTKTLGPLAEADETLRQALLTYVQCGFNTTRAANSLYAHRNTVERRVSRANELSVVKVEDNPTHVAAALLVLDIAPNIAAHLNSATAP